MDLELPLDPQEEGYTRRGANVMSLLVGLRWLGGVAPGCDSLASPSVLSLLTRFDMLVFTAFRG